MNKIKKGAKLNGTLNFLSIREKKESRKETAEVFKLGADNQKRGWRFIEE